MTKCELCGDMTNKPPGDRCGWNTEGVNCPGVLIEIDPAVSAAAEHDAADLKAAQMDAAGL